MKKVLNKTKAGSQEHNDPRRLGGIVEEMLHGDSPLAKGYSHYVVSRENVDAEEHGRYANTELGCNVKTLLCSDKRMKANKEYLGILRLDSEADIDEFCCYDPHMTFIEVVRPTARKRNPHVFAGQFITVTRREDGACRPNLRPMPKGMSVDEYAFGVANEIRESLNGLIEEKLPCEE